MALSCIISEIKRDIGLKSQFFHTPPAYDAPTPLVESLSEYCHNVMKQELSYRKQITRKLRTQYAESIYDNPVTLKSMLTVTQGHWKRNHWVDHTRVSGRWILSWSWHVGQRSLKVIEISAIRKLGCHFLFAFYSNYGRICSRLRYSVSKNGVTLKTRLGVVQGRWKWHRSIDHYATFCWSAIVNIALSCAIFELFDVE